MTKILGIGNAVLDIILTVPYHPNEDQEMRASDKRVVSGGNINNTLYILNQLGHQVSICSTLATDPESKLLLKSLNDRNIQTDHIQKFIKGQTPSSFVTLNAENGHRTIVHYRDLPEVTFEHFAKIEIEQFDWLHFEGRNIENLTGMLNIAKTFLTHQPISLEVEKSREGIEALFSHVNVIIFSHHYATENGYTDGKQLLSDIKQQAPNANLICTWGNRGVWYAPINSNVEHIAAEHITPLVDTLGAGDTFNAALIDQLIQKKSLSTAVAYANHLAGQKCRQAGLDNLLEITSQRKPLANTKQLSSAKTLVIDIESGLKSIILIKFNESVRAYENNCPHQNVPLNEAYKIDVNPFEKTLKCSVHDAFFKIEDGLCTDGPCWNESLTTIEIEIEENGDIYLA